MRNQAADLSGLPVDRDVMFSNYKNEYKKRIEKRQTKLLNKISFIKPFLKKDEKILLVTTGCSPMSVMEQFLTGSIIYYLKRALLVFTNKRIFHIPTKYDYSYKNSMAQILYADCLELTIKGRTLTAKYKSGQKEKFYYLAGKEKHKIWALLQSTPLAGEESGSRERAHLCPRCASELYNDKYVCQNCNLSFKGKEDAKRIAIIYPGGGYFYTGHPLLGAGDALAEFALMVFVIISLVDTIKGLEGGLVGLIIFSIFLVIEKVTSVYHSNHFVKEFIPKEKVIKPIAVAS